MEKIIEQYGGDLISGIIAFLIIGLAGWLFYNKYLKDSNDAPQKIIMLKSCLILNGVFEALIAGFAAAGTEDVPLGMRVAIHGGLLVFNTVLTYGIWKEFKEAVVASQDLLKLFEDSKFMTWEYGSGIIWNFLMEWMQVFMVLLMATAAIMINMYLMGLSTGQLDLVHAAASFSVPFIEMPAEYEGWEFMEIVREMRVDVAGNFFLSHFHVGGILLLGLLSRDKTLHGKGSGASTPTFTKDQILGYYEKHITVGGTALSKSNLSALLNVDTTNKFANELALEELFVIAIDNTAIAKDASKPGPDRNAANAKVVQAHKDMEKLIKEIEDRAAAITGGTT